MEEKMQSPLNALLGREESIGEGNGHSRSHIGIAPSSTLEEGVAAVTTGGSLMQQGRAPRTSFRYTAQSPSLWSTAAPSTPSPRHAGDAHAPPAVATAAATPSTPIEPPSAPYLTVGTRRGDGDGPVDGNDHGSRIILAQPQHTSSTSWEASVAAQASRPPSSSASPAHFSMLSPPTAVSTTPEDIPSGLPALTKVMDASQIRAATHPADSPLLLQAGAGSGKTQTMAARIAVLLQRGVPAHTILSICFTRQAAETLRERVRAVLPPTLARQAHALKLKTFHAFGLECLRRFGVLAADTPVLDAHQQYKLARRVVDTHAQREKSSEAVADLVDYANRVKTMKVPPIAQTDPGVQDAYLFPFYQRALHTEQQAVDFGDLQQMFYDLLRPVVAVADDTEGGTEDPDRPSRCAKKDPTAPSAGGTESAPPQLQQQKGLLVPSSACSVLRREYTHFVVDEFQDFNEIQVELLALLAGDECRVTCVGDPNQCIYTWRGAMPNVFDVWRRRFPKTTVLTLAVNYRSDGPIVNAANQVVRATQLAHHHREERAVTLVQCTSEEEELQAVPLVVEHVLRRRDPQLRYGDMAILCRSRRRVQLFCDLLQSHRIPVHQLQRISVDRLAAMRSFLASLRVCVSPHSPEGDADMRTILSAAPLHRLPPATAKKFFLSLESVCQARRTTEAAHVRAWRHAMTWERQKKGEEERGGGGTLCGAGRWGSGGGDRDDDASAAVQRTTPGVHPEMYSFFAVLQELVYRNFSPTEFPKLEIPKRHQKTIRSVLSMLVHARELLAQPSCDVEQVLRFILREGGYESDSMAAVVARTSVGVKRARHGTETAVGAMEADNRRTPLSYPSQCIPRRGAHLADICTSQHNEQQRAHARGWDGKLSPVAVARHCQRASVGRDGAAAAAGDADALPPEEEAAWWEEQRMNIAELVLHTYHTVYESLQREVACEREGGGSSGDDGGHMNHPERLNSPSSAPSPEASLSNASAKSATTTAAVTAMQALRPPTVVLRRVLDEFVSLVASDDYGPTREKSGDAVAASSSWMGQVTVGTVHRAKGMEWPAVLLPGCWVGEFPVRPRIEEERRIFYVGMSRAMKHLVCFTAGKREGAGGGGSGTVHDDASIATVVPAGSNDAFTAQMPTGTLEPTPYLSLMGDTLERVAFTHLKMEYLREQGYL